MKVGILTTHRANNFGAILQAYSLVCAANEIGADAEIVDYRCHAYEYLYHRAWRMHRNPLPAIKHFVYFMTQEKATRVAFEKFRNKVKTSKPYLTSKSLLEANKIYDRFIVGSDQVWNPINSSLGNVNKYDRTYLLNFVDENKKKNSYAASIGVKKLQNISLEEEMARAWKTYNIITMREEEGSRLVRDLSGREADTVLDPVLLHDKSFWRRLYDARKKLTKNPFLFVYDLQGSKILADFVKKLQDENGYDVISPVIPAFGACDKTKQNISPENFVQAIDQCEAVVTNSFHASAFSVIFGKKLYLQKAEKVSSPNTRFTYLKTLCKLKEEAILKDDISALSLYDCEKASVEEIEKARGKSFAFLRDICGVGEVAQNNYPPPNI